MATTRAGGPGAPTGEPASRTEAGRTARGVLWLATNGVVVKTSQTVVLLALAATLAPDALGLVALGTLVVNASSQLASLGTANAVVYWRGDAQRAARTAVSIGIIASLVIMAVIWVLAPALAAVLRAGADGVPVVRGLAVTLPFVAVATVTNELLRRRLAFLRRIVPDATASVVGAGVAIVLLTNGGGVMSLVVGQVVQAVLALALAWCVHPPVRPGWNRDDARGLLAYGGPMAGGNLLELVQLNLDYLVVSVVLGTAALGQYSLAYRIAFVPYLMVAVVVAGAAYPLLCRLRERRLGEATSAVAAALGVALTPLCLGLVLMADHVVLLGDTWQAAVAPLALLGVYAWLLGLGLILLTALNAAGRPGVSVLLRLAHAATLVAVLPVVAPRGITAVAWAQVLLALVLVAAGLTAARVVVAGFSVRALGARLYPSLVAGGALTLAVVAARLALDGRGASLESLLVAAPAGGLAYAVALWSLDRSRLVALARLLRPEASSEPSRTASEGGADDLGSSVSAGRPAVERAATTLHQDDQHDARRAP